MVFKILLLVAFIGCVRSSVVPLHSAPLQEAIKSEYDHHPQYAYAYDVQDTNTGDFKSQHEVRSGDVVKGSYSVVDPDGTKRTVDYTADDVNGFNAVVRKEPITNSATPIITQTVTKVDTPALVTRVETPVVAAVETPTYTNIQTPVIATNVQAPVIATNVATPVVAKLEAPVKYIEAPVKYLTAPYDVSPVKYVSSPYNLPFGAPVKYVATDSYPSVAKYVSTPSVKYIPNTYPNPVAVAKLDTKYVAESFPAVAPVKYVSTEPQVAYTSYSSPLVSQSYTPSYYKAPYVAAYKNGRWVYAVANSYNTPLVGKLASSPVAYAKYEIPTTSPVAYAKYAVPAPNPVAYAKYEVPQYYETPVIAKYASPSYNELW